MVSDRIPVLAGEENRLLPASVKARLAAIKVGEVGQSLDVAFLASPELEARFQSDGVGEPVQRHSVIFSAWNGLPERHRRHHETGQAFRVWQRS